MNVLVTGGGGFIGSALIRELIKRDYCITSFSRGDYPNLRRLGVTVKRGDLSDKETVFDACEGMDVVFHVAAKAGMWGSFSDYYRTNVTGTQNIVNACIAKNVKGLIYTSSTSVVFDGRDIVNGDESLPYSGSSLSHYISTKALAERIVLNANSPGLMTIALRPHIVIGPGDNHLIPRLIDRAGRGKLIQIGDGKNLVDITSNSNAAMAHICALDSILKDSFISSGKAYFISNGEPVLLWDLINTILKGAGLDPVRKSISVRSALALSYTAEALNKIFRIKKEPVLTRFAVYELAKSHWFNITSARELLNYTPETSNQESVEMVIASLGTCG
ncbi:MAG: NAD-dependent epimerase/dehydratase family protein [Bacteroidales bacterium]|jgi:nucleoside-diphosphate-sugar epimerase|nr:NAD-dependent epimerase/dehydratase family protein [Bacteroidales bacterium]